MAEIEVFADVCCPSRTLDSAASSTADTTSDVTSPGCTCGPGP